MPVINYEVSAIDARKFTKMGEAIRNVQINHNSTVSNIVETSSDKVDVEWRFTVNYSGVGLIKIEGHILFQGDAVSISKQWASEHKMPDEMAGEIHRAVMNNCIPQAVLLARDLRIPPPIPMPQINIKGSVKKDEKAGYGVEFA
ncbi:MAG TPA: hypothetical protein ENN76_03600 [Euryarchaeota archaeon]|nr:hypothetical protein [Euryarchaeota archaeon]